MHLDLQKSLSAAFQRIKPEWLLAGFIKALTLLAAVLGVWPRRGLRAVSGVLRAVCTTLLMVLAGGQAALAQQTVFDVAGSPLVFSGGSTSSQVAGYSYTYQNVKTIDGHQIDAVVTVVSLNNATMSAFDSTSNPYGSGDGGGAFFQPNFNFSAIGGSATLRFDFVDHSTGAAVTLKNVYINTYDLDGSGQQSSGRQYTDFSGIASYAVSTDTKIDIQTPSAGVTRFVTTVGGDLPPGSSLAVM